MFFALLASLVLAGSDDAPRAVVVKLPSQDRSPILRDGSPRRDDAAAAVVKRRFFGLGIGFATRGDARGIALDQVVPASPAERAGLGAGTVIAEINGESTLGRSGEDCTRMVRESGNVVAIKYFDPATLKLRERTLEKAWFLLPN
jgi:S1-C subfamily serine protease